MIRSSLMFFAIVFLVGSANAMPFGARPVAPISGEPLKVRLTKSNACKLKYKHKKAAQDLREKAHCK
jgi:hypothetical protein